jgi:hypothetical protein
MFNGIEILVLSLCLGKYDCTHASSAYYATPEVKEYISRVKNKTTKFVGQDNMKLITLTAPAIAIGFGGSGNIRLSKNWSLEVGGSGGKIIIHFDY